MDSSEKKLKKKTLITVPGRDEQFLKIARLKEETRSSQNPLVSIDTKKKEPLGNLFRPGKLLTKEEIQVLDHALPNYTDGFVIPHGIYDLKQNKGFVNLGTSADTSEFVTDSIELWWTEEGEFDYPNATEIVILCDGGGSNSSLHYIWKADLQNLSNRLGVQIRIAHYPPYCSKYNPIEHKLFPHMTRAAKGVIFKHLGIAQEVFRQTSTKTGLSVVVRLLEKSYRKGRKAVESFKKNLTIVRDEEFPKWNYVAHPQSFDVDII